VLGGSVFVFFFSKKAAPMIKSQAYGPLIREILKKKSKDWF
jgi:hypothetical protein